MTGLLAAAICSWLLFAELPKTGTGEVGHQVSIVDLAAPKQASGISTNTVGSSDVPCADWPGQ